MADTMFPMDQICISIRTGLKENGLILFLISYSIGFWAACYLDVTLFLVAGGEKGKVLKEKSEGSVEF